MQSYPSPSAAAADNGCPFYSSNNGQNQQQTSLQSSEELQLTAQLTSLAPMIGVGPNDTISVNHGARGQIQNNVGHPYENERDQHTHLHPSPGSLDQLGGHYGTQNESLAPRKRTKVSRACDECRRKKIRCDATNDQSDEHCSNCKRVGARCQFSRVPMKRGPSKGYIKELADRLHTLEGAIHSGEIVHPYLSQNDNSLPHRDSEEFSPPPNIDGFSRKRRISATADFGPYLVQRPIVSWNPAPQDTSRNLSHSSSDLVSPNAAQSATQIFTEPTHSPSTLQTAIWRNEPAQFRHLDASFEDLGQDEIVPKREFELDSSILEAYYELIQPTYCLLPYNKNKVFDQLESCPAPLSEAMHEAISVAVNSFLESNTTSVIDNVKMRKTSQHVLVSSLENPTSRSLRVNIVNLQTMLLFAIAVENIALNHPKKTSSYSCSVWIGNTISLAYAMKLFLYKPKKIKDTDLDTDENVARRLWWSIYAMDRWSAASTSSPVLIPDTASVLYPDDLPLLGEVLWNLARLSTILGHISTINTVSSSLPPFSVPLASAYGATVKGELERVRESFPSTDCHPLVLMAYWHLRILVELQLVDSEPNDLLNITANAINHINRNSEFISPLRFHFIFLIILTLIDLLDYDMTKSQSKIELDSILVKQLISADWAVVVGTILTKKNSLVSGITTPPVNSQPQTQSLSQSQSLEAADAEQHNIDIENLVRLADLATAAGAKRECAPTKNGNSEYYPCVTNSSPFRYYIWLREQVRSGFLNVFTQELA